jgi:hypothetical protein
MAIELKYVFPKHIFLNLPGAASIEADILLTSPQAEENLKILPSLSAIVATRLWLRPSKDERYWTLCGFMMKLFVIEDY